MFKLVQLKATAPYTITGTIYDSLCVGRGPQNELCSQDRLISTSHARFFVRAGVLQIVDLDSRNGSEVNGSRLVPFEATVLKPGDTIDFAGRLAFQIDVEHDGLPAISVEDKREEVPEDDSVIRVLALQEGRTPMLEPSQILGLNQLLQKLLDPKIQRAGIRWAAQLTEGVTRLLKVADVHLIKLGAHKRIERLHPQNPATATRQDAIHTCLERGESLSIELSALEPGVELSATIDSDGGGLILPVLTGLIPGPEGPWGVLYATTEGLPGRRVFGEPEIYIMDTVARWVAGFLPQVSLNQVLARERTRYHKLIHLARDNQLVGRSPLLGCALETAAALAPDPSALFLNAPDGAEAERWGELIHRLSTRHTGAFLHLDIADTEGDVSPLERHMNAAIGGTLVLTAAHLAAPAQWAYLAEQLQQGWARRARLITAASPSPEDLVRTGVDPQLVLQLAVRTLRIPPLHERPEDVPLIISAIAPLDAFDTDALRLLEHLHYPGDVAQLRAEIQAYLERFEARPISLTQLVPDGLDASPLHTRYRPAASPRRRPHTGIAGFHPLATGPSEVPLAPLTQTLLQVGLLDEG